MFRAEARAAENVHEFNSGRQFRGNINKQGRNDGVSRLLPGLTVGQEGGRLRNGWPQSRLNT
jgi:hypothetical protein